ncbi:MAG: hypothetical protein ACO331_12890 [Prochlorothrix sp.]
MAQAGPRRSGRSLPIAQDRLPDLPCPRPNPDPASPKLSHPYLPYLPQSSYE